MTTIPAGNLTKLREQQQHSNIYLSVLNPDKLLQARVNNGAITRGARSIAYDNGTGTAGEYARIVAGQTLWIGTSAGTYDVGKVRIKSITGNQVAGTITIAENGIDWVDDLYLTIIDFYDIWPIPPFINTAGVFYKDYDIAYTDQNEDIYPIPIMGPHRAGFLSGGSLVFTLDGSDSYAMANGAAISSYAWTATGGAIANAAIATTTITFTNPGYYWVTLTVTDDNGKSQLTRRCYFVYNNTTDTPYRNFAITNCGGDWNSAGWQFSIDAFGDVELTDFPDGTLCVLWHQNYISDSEDYVNIWDIGNEVICAGYLQRDVDTDDLAESGTGSVSFDVISPTLYLQQKNIAATVAIEANNNPAEWNEFITAVCTAGRCVHHLLRWHSTVIQTCDVLGLTDNTLQVYQVAFSEDSLLDMVNAFAFERGIFAKLASARDGRLYFVEDSNYLDETDRGLLDTIFSIIAQDLSSAPQLAREPLERTSLAFMDGFDFDGTPPGDAFTFLIPGYIANSVSYPIPEFWGRGSIQKSRQILNNEADGQMKCGRILHNANNPLRELRLDFRANYLGAFDIVPNVGWYAWGITDATLTRGLDLLNTKWLCRRVSLRFNTTGGEISTSVILEGEAFGEDAITAEYPVEYPTPTPPDPNWNIPAVAAVYGYWGGGSEGGVVVTTDRINFSTQTTAANAASNLTIARRGIGTLSDISTYGYFAGGINGTIYDDTDRITFSTFVTAANAASNRSADTSLCPGMSDGSAYGYWTGGDLTSGGGGTSTTDADRITFATGATAAYANADLSGDKWEHSPISDKTTYGYWCGGSDDTFALQSSIDRTVFATGVTAATAEALSAARTESAGISDNSLYGYISGGWTPNINTPVNTCDRVTFSTGVFAVFAGGAMVTARLRFGAASDGLTYGYWNGGRNGVPALLDTAEQITFSTGACALKASANTSAARDIDTSNGVSDGAV